MKGLLAAFVLILLPGVAAAQDAARAHMEACIRWEPADGEIQTVNLCNTPISIKVMGFDNQTIVQGDVPPGALFDSHVTLPQMAKGLMYTVCPAGYVPDIRFDFKNASQIMKSIYRCIPHERPDS
jgi:hypothetical protein